MIKLKKKQNIAGVWEWIAFITCLAIMAFACAVAWDVVWRAVILIVIAVFISAINKKYSRVR